MKLDITARFERASSGSSPDVPTNFASLVLMVASCFGKAEERVQFPHEAPIFRFWLILIVSKP